MDLIYKIYSVYLYDNQLDHDWIFLYNRKPGYTGQLDWDPPFYMFSSYGYSASNQIHKIDKNDSNRKETSIKIMMNAAKREGILMIRAKDFISLVPIEEGRVTYSSGVLPGDIVETEGQYKGLKKQIYTPYEIIWNETRSGVNPHEFEVMGVWNEGSSTCTTYRIWETKSEREKVVRDYKLINILGNK